MKPPYTEKKKLFAKLYMQSNFDKFSAYRDAGYPEASDQTMIRNANRLTHDPIVLDELDRLKKRAMKRHDITIDSLIDELEEARQKGLKARTPQVKACVDATMAKARLCGFVLEKSQEDPEASANASQAQLTIPGDRLKSVLKEVLEAI